MRKTLAGGVGAFAQGLIRGYQGWVSPGLLPCCRFVPTCSDYALESVRRRGVVRGGLAALWRILRCHPFSAAGVDPVDD